MSREEVLGREEMRASQIGCRSSAAWRRRQARRVVVEGGGVGGGSEGEGELGGEEERREREWDRGGGCYLKKSDKWILGVFVDMEYDV
jgi:hypothetical protein